LEASTEFVAIHGSQTNAEYVQSLYANALGRLPGEGEGAAWELQLTSGAEDRSDVLLHFVNSEEGRQHLDWAL
jgi:hypothetical protein